jgi:long-chain acyl-CoA synthetase
MVTVGGTAIVMRKFDAEQALAAIERYRATHSQWVPTMFVRLLDLPAEVREHYDLSSLRVAIHAAAPCPVAVKERMIEWWGLVIHEYYAGSEALGMTAIGAADWLTHKGSVGRATIGVVHIVGEDGQDLPVGEVGTVYFADGPPFEYHNAPEKTRAAFNGRGWATYGDLGWLDEDGYLYLGDRRTDLIISGGVNIYPAEIESVLITHPEVADAAVIGVAHAEFGEEVKAIVELKGTAAAGSAAAERLIAHCREHLSHLKCPRTIDFEAHLPRLDSGKLLRRVLKERYRRPAAPTG